MLADLALDGDDLVGLARLAQVFPAQDQLIIFLERVVESLLVALVRRLVAPVAAHHMGRVDAERLDDSAHQLAFACGYHVHVEIVCLQVRDDLEHRLVERLSVRHAGESLDFLVCHVVGHVGVEFVSGHAFERLGKRVVFLVIAVCVSKRDSLICRFADVLAQVHHLVGGGVGRVVLHAVEEQHVVGIHGRPFAQERSIHVEHRDAVLGWHVSCSTFLGCRLDEGDERGERFCISVP